MLLEKVVGKQALPEEDSCTLLEDDHQLLGDRSHLFIFLYSCYSLREDHRRQCFKALIAPYEPQVESLELQCGTHTNWSSFFSIVARKASNPPRLYHGAIGYQRSRLIIGSPGCQFYGVCDQNISPISIFFNLNLTPIPVSVLLKWQNIHKWFFHKLYAAGIGNWTLKKLRNRAYCISLLINNRTMLFLVAREVMEWERPGPGRRPDIFPQFSPMKTPLPPPLPADPPEEDEDEEEKKEEDDPEKEPEKPEE
eukprot:Gb_13758 [translate_table: standard]